MPMNSHKVTSIESLTCAPMRWALNASGTPCALNPQNPRTKTPVLQMQARATTNTMTGMILHTVPATLMSAPVLVPSNATASMSHRISDEPIVAATLLPLVKVPGMKMSSVDMMSTP